MQLEQRVIETIRVLAPDKQEAVLAFAESLQQVRDSKNGSVDLARWGIGIEQAGKLQFSEGEATPSRLTPFAEDWNRPEMDAYDEL